ncbi:MAG: hypothetical protein ACXWEY_10745 [Bacteroidia bacterium]
MLRKYSLLTFTMKKQYILFLLGLFIIFTFSSASKLAPNTNGKIGYYLTYDDYLKKKLVEVDDYKGATYFGFPADSEVGFIFKKDNKKVKIKGDDIWGFTYKTAVFRVVPGKGAFARVISVNKIIYYENGQAHTNMLIDNTTKARFENGEYIYFSKDLNSPMLGWQETKSKWNDFFNKNKEHKALFTCVQSGKRTFEETRNCAAEYNGTNDIYAE